MTTSYNQPLGGNELPRFAGIATMMRLPHVADPSQLDVGFVGIPLDIGTSNRSGARFGPRAIRAESVLLRPFNMATRAAPFDAMQVGDVGDLSTNPYDLKDSVRLIREGYARLIEHGCKLIAMGGDHTLTYPVLQAIHQKWGPVGLIHVDAHADVNDTMSGEKIAHGTPFRRALEEGLLDANRVFQIGLRGTGYSAEDFDWCREQGFTVIQAEDCWHKSLTPLMEDIRRQLGDGPVYLSFDIDGIDPAYAPGTGTPEIGGLTVPQALEIIRGLKGCQLVGADLVEVSPPYDVSGMTALLAANLAYEILCVFPGVAYRD